MTPLVWVAIVVLVGVVLIAGASRATVSVSDGPVFVKWMMVVFAAFLALAAIPIFVGS